MLICVYELSGSYAPTEYLDFTVPAHGMAVCVANAESLGKSLEARIGQFIDISDGPVTIEIPEVYADDLREAAELWADGEPVIPDDYLSVVLQEWMRPEVGLTIVTIPGDKSMRDDFEIHAYTGRIVAAGVDDE